MLRLQVAQGQMDGLVASREQMQERLEQQILATRRTVQDHASQAATVRTSACFGRSQSPMLSRPCSGTAPFLAPVHAPTSSTHTPTEPTPHTHD